MAKCKHGIELGNGSYLCGTCERDELSNLRNEVTLLEIENSELVKRNENLEWRIEIMKPHFGQSDAAMNKLAGINQLPNNNKPADLSKLRNVPCSCVPCKHYEVSIDHGPCVSCRDHAKFEEKDFDPVAERDAAYDRGFQDAQALGYYGHENGCDCAVCEDMTQRELSRKIVDAEWNKLLDDNATLIKQVEEITDRMGRDVQFWKEETRRAIEAGDLSYVKSIRSFKVLNDVNDKYRDALHIIAHMGISGLSWQHDYEKCVNIAKESLEI